MQQMTLRLWGAAGVLAATALACGQTDSDSASNARSSDGDAGTTSGGTSGASGSDPGGSSGSGASDAGGASGSGGSSGAGGATSGGAAGAAAGGGCPVPGESRNVNFSFSVDPVVDPYGDSTISEGMYPCVIVVPEYENDTMVLHLECDQMMDTSELLPFGIAVSADPDPSWGEFEAGTRVEFRWRVDTHGWRLYRWVSLVEADSQAPLLIAYVTGSEFEPERLEPFAAELVTDQCPALQQTCYRAEPQALALRDSDSNSLTLFPRTTGWLGDYHVWVSVFEARSDFECTDIPPREYSVGILLEPPR